MKRYPKYKDSDVEWIGEIPKNWKVLKIKRLTPIKRGASPRPIDDPKYFDENGEFSWVRIADVTASERYLKQTTQTLSELGSSLSVKRYPGDFFVSIAGSVGKPIITKIKCCIHDGFVWFPYLDINSEFLYYMFSAGELYQGLGKWGTQLNLNTETIGDIHIPLPLDSEIENVVNYLDHKTNQIDALIEKKQKQIELLKEQRTAVINYAVTKGLNPNVKMKDSGTDWLGEIPAHWEVCLIKRKIDNITDGAHISPETENGKYPFISIVDIKNSGIDFQNCLLTSEDNYQYLKRNNCNPKKNDILFSKDGTIGRTVLITENKEFVIASSLIIITPDISRLFPQFLNFLYQSSLVVEQINSFVKGAALKRISIQNISKIFGVFPPVKEQIEIANYIECQISRIDDILFKLEKGIELINEYRTTLISEAVTGKIDVRDEVPL